MTEPAPKPGPVPALIFDQLVEDFRAGVVSVDYRPPAPLDPSIPIEDDNDPMINSSTMTG
jgi:hypothetical protein